MSNSLITGEQFLHQRNPSLHKSREVEGVVSYLQGNGEKIPNEPGKKIEKYLGFLAHTSYVNDGLLTGEQGSKQRQIEGLIIQSDEVPESYFDLQRRIYREQGMGDFAINEPTRRELIATIQADQRHSLEMWANYLTDASNQTTYPLWFRKYAWDGMKKLGRFDKEKGVFTKRSNHTVAPYADLNAEALTYVYDTIYGVHRLGLDNEEKITQLARSGDFAKLYAHAILEVTPASIEQRKVTVGSWKKYDAIEGEYDPDYDMEGDEATDRTPVDDPTAMELAESLQGHGTGWCTAGNRTAAHQLSAGDFYVYYSRDEQGKDTIPRVAIRMEYGAVAEVRGIEEGQGLEDAMTDIATEQLMQLPGGEDYADRVQNMRRVTEIYERYDRDNTLSVEDLKMLYCADLEGLGYYQDPRVEELLSTRDQHDDVRLLVQHYGREEVLEEMSYNLQDTRLVKFHEILGPYAGNVAERLSQAALERLSRPPYFIRMETVGLDHAHIEKRNREMDEKYRFDIKYLVSIFSTERLIETMAGQLEPMHQTIHRDVGYTIQMYSDEFAKLTKNPEGLMDWLVKVSFASSAKEILAKTAPLLDNALLIEKYLSSYSWHTESLLEAVLDGTLDTKTVNMPELMEKIIRLFIADRFPRSRSNFPEMLRQACGYLDTGQKAALIREISGKLEDPDIRTMDAINLREIKSILA
jgi:hypothetical protein